MQDIIISRATIKEIAQRIYDDVDAYDYQDSGYSLKDVELAVRDTLANVVYSITSDFVSRALGDNILHDQAWKFRPRRHCDVTDCEVPVRSENDILCYYHGKIEDKRQAEVEVAMAAQFDDLEF